MKISCCKDCPDRHYACHASCEKYLSALEQYHAEKDYNYYKNRVVRSAATMKRSKKHYSIGLDS